MHVAQPRWAAGCAPPPFRSSKAQTKMRVAWRDTTATLAPPGRSVTPSGRRQGVRSGDHRRCGAAGAPFDFGERARQRDEIGQRLLRVDWRGGSHRVRSARCRRARWRLPCRCPTGGRRCASHPRTAGGCPAPWCATRRPDRHRRNHPPTMMPCLPGSVRKLAAQRRPSARWRRPHRLPHSRGANNSCGHIRASARSRCSATLCAALRQDVEPHQHGPQTILLAHMVRARAEAFLAADRRLSGIEQIAEELPARGRFETGKPSFSATRSAAALVGMERAMPARPRHSPASASHWRRGWRASRRA